MANIKSAKKRARQAEKRARNASARSMLRTAIKKVVRRSTPRTRPRRSVHGSPSRSWTVTSRGLIHKNKAARHKSRLTAHIKALA